MPESSLEDGLEGSFEIDLTEAIRMEVDNESFVHEDAGMRFIMQGLIIT